MEAEEDTERGREEGRKGKWGYLLSSLIVPLNVLAAAAHRKSVGSMDPTGMPSVPVTTSQAKIRSLEKRRHFDWTLAKMEKFLEGWQEVNTSGPAQLHQEGEK